MALFRCTLKSTIFGQHCANVLHIYKDAAIEAHMTQLAQRLSEHWVRYCAFNQSEAVSYYEVRVERVDSGTGWAPVVLAIDNGGSFFSGVHNIPFLCMVIQVRVSGVGRRGRGRFFLSGMNVQTENGLWDASALAVFQDLCNTLTSIWINDSGAFGFLLTVASGQNEVDWVLAETLVPRPQPGSQVRRKIGRGM